VIDLQKLTEMAELQFTIDELAIIFETTPENLQSEECQKAIQRGRLQAESLVRHGIYTMAKNGSSPAIKDFLDLVKQRNRKDAIRYN
jgi:hypothetical protein